MFAYSDKIIGSLGSRRIPKWLTIAFLIHILLLSGCCFAAVLLLIFDGEATTLEKSSIYLFIFETICFLIYAISNELSVPFYDSYRGNTEAKKYTKALQRIIK